MIESGLFYLLLVAVGVFAGFVNTIAGGGSALTIPALMMMGLPADVANATNRVSVLLQTGVGVVGFRKQAKLDSPDTGLIIAITLVGGLLGAVLAAYLPNLYLKPLLLGSMVAMALVILVAPNVVIPQQGTAIKRVAQTPTAWLGLMIAGIYGGFVQAGVGFILIAAIAGSLRYDILRTNAFKVLTVFIFTFVALVIFVINDLIAWVPGLILAAGSMVGAHFSVRFAISASQKTLKWLLFGMTLVAAGAAMIF